MKILLLSRKYPPYIGGAQTQLKFLAEELAKTHDVTVAIISSGAESRGVFDAVFESIGTRLGRTPEDIECFASGNSVISDRAPRVQRFDFSLIDKLRILLGGETSRLRILQQKIEMLLEDAEVVHSFKPDRVALAALAATRERRRPMAVTPYIHTRDVAPAFVDLMQKCEIIFYLTENDKRVLSDLEIPVDRLAHMGVAPLILTGGDAARFRARHGLGDYPIVLFLGRMVKYKGAPLVREACQAVWSRHADTRFVFAGPVVDQDLDFSVDGDPRVVLLGTITEEEKADAMAACDIFCMPSEQEILPAVYLEAWSYRKPVIGGIAEGVDQLMLQSGGGFVSSDNAECLADIIVKLLGDEELRRRLGDAGHSYVANHCALPVVAGRLASAYSQMISHRLPDPASV